MSPKDTFEDRQGNRKSYVEYYREVYNIGGIDIN